MRIPRAATLGLIGLALVTTKVRAQQSDSFKWYLGAQAGLLGFETQSQLRGWAPSVGAQLNIVAKRSGLIISVDEAFGSNETTQYTDATTEARTRDVSFDRIRKYSAILTGYPVRGRTQPYFGIGFGLMQVMDPVPGGIFTSPIQANLARQLASRKSTDGFVTLVGGIQFRVSQMVAFGQYQLASSPSAGNLLRGPTHSLVGGLRFSLGAAKEGIHGGGY